MNFMSKESTKKQLALFDVVEKIEKVQQQLQNSGYLYLHLFKNYLAILLLHANLKIMVGFAKLTPHGVG